MVGNRYDGKTILRYVYDGDHCIAEYNGAGALQRKYVYSLSVDEPICMIEGAATSYYHFDALGSVIALTDANGDVEQEYEYSVWGQVGASDPNHSNRFMFTGREFDKETGLYYYRARYYHPEIGRFLQTDPIGYGDGMNWYRYCGNSPLNGTDPSGLETIYLLHEYQEGYSYLFKLTPGINRVTGEEQDWDLAGIASMWGVDPSRLEEVYIPGYGKGYVIRGEGAGYWDNEGKIGNREQLFPDDPVEYELIADAEEAAATAAKAPSPTAAEAPSPTENSPDHSDKILVFDPVYGFSKPDPDTIYLKPAWPPMPRAHWWPWPEKWKTNWADPWGPRDLLLSKILTSRTNPFISYPANFFDSTTMGDATIHGRKVREKMKQDQDDCLFQLIQHPHPRNCRCPLCSLKKIRKSD